MNWKRILAAGALAGALTISSAGALTVNIDGKALTGQVILENGTTYVPLRSAARQLGDVEVSWDGSAARVASDSLELTAVPGAAWLEANGRRIRARGGVRLVDGTTYVPIRALCAAMGGRVVWDGAAQTVWVTTGDTSAYTAQDLYWLSRIISAESRGEPLEGKLAVGTVVLNRVASSEFPDTIHDVIFDRKWGVQFTPVANGTIYQEPTPESTAAAKMVLEGARAAGNSLYFVAPGLTSDRWAANNRPYVTTIGCHQFYA